MSEQHQGVEDSSGRALQAAWLAGFVPAGMYGDSGRARPTGDCSVPSYRTLYHTTRPVGLTELARRLLRDQPAAALSLRQIAGGVGLGPGSRLWALNSAMCKLVKAGEVVKTKGNRDGAIVMLYRISDAQ